MFSNLVLKINDETIRDIIKTSRAAAAAASDKKGDDAESKAQVVRIFMELFARVSANFASDVESFFCDLIGVSAEEYESLPIDIDVQILNQLKDAPEVVRFFTGLSQLSSATSWFRNMSQSLKERFQSVISSAQKK